NVGCFRAARAHAREGLMARSVNEHNLAAVNVNFRGANMLRDASGLSRSDFSLADRVEKAGFAMIDMAHHGNHGRAWQEVFRLLFPGDFLDDVFLERKHFDDAI